jgi:hypothetical protein
MSKMIQLRNVSDDLHKKLKVRAAANGQSLSDYLISEMRVLAERATPNEIRERLLSRAPLMVRESPASAVRSERESA